MKTDTSKVARKLKERHQKLRLEIADVEGKLHKLQSKCKHEFVADGMDNKYYYAKCRKCLKSIRYEHNFASSDEAYAHFKAEVKNKIVTPKQYEPYWI